MNKYTYTYNNPLRYTDPNGHCAWDLCLAEYVVVTVAVTTVVVKTNEFLQSPEGQEFRDKAGQLAQRGVEALSSLLFAKDAEAAGLQDAADRTIEAATDALGKLTEATTGRELTDRQQSESSRRAFEIQKGMDKVKEAKDNLANAKGGKAIDAAKQELAKATEEVKSHIKPIEDLARHILK